MPSHEFELEGEFEQEAELPIARARVGEGTR